MISTRVEKHVIRKSNKYYGMLDEFCHLSKNLYNHANFVVRNEFAKNEKWIREYDLSKLLHDDNDYPDYKLMPCAQSAQQTIKLVDKNWKSFFASIKDWKSNKSKYLGRPKLPKYLPKDGKFVFVLTNQQCHVKHNKLVFPKAFNGFTVTPYFLQRDDFVKFNMVRIVPRSERIEVELVYTIESAEMLEDNGRYLGIDIGVDNLATCAREDGSYAFIINGKPLKSMNQFYNKLKSQYQADCKKTSGKDYSHRLRRLDTKRNDKINDYLHKASKKIVDYCIANNVNTIIIGKNKGWKQNANIGKRNNQNFVQIPFARFIEMITYKAKEFGIAVTTTEESYTSGTSFIDNEEPTKGNYNKSRRVHRGLFKSNDGTEINADLNGAYQIIKKVIPIKWDRGCVLHPLLVTV